MARVSGTGDECGFGDAKDETMIINEPFGWVCILVGFFAGAGLGLKFYQPDFLGGYGSLARRMLRLGHIALIALGALNILFAFSTYQHDYLDQQLHIVCAHQH